MVLFLQILTALALISFIVLVIRLLVSLGKIEVVLNKTSDSIDTITKQIKELSTNINEAIQDLKELKADAKASIEKINNFGSHLQLISQKSIAYFDDLRGVTKPYEQLVSNAYPKIAEPVNKTLSLISAFSKAFSTFKEKLGTKRQA